MPNLIHEERCEDFLSEKSLNLKIQEYVSFIKKITRFLP